jgi:hypothetical protein
MKKQSDEPQASDETGSFGLVRWIERHLSVSDEGKTTHAFSVRPSDGEIPWDTWQVSPDDLKHAKELAADIEGAIDAVLIDLPPRKHTFFIIAHAKDMSERGRKLKSGTGKSPKSTLNASGSDSVVAGVDALVATMKNVLGTVNTQLDQQRSHSTQQAQLIEMLITSELKKKMQLLDTLE